MAGIQDEHISTISIGGRNLRNLRLAQATSAMVRLTTIWNSKDIRFKLKYNLYRSIVLSILTYECEYWTSSAISTLKIQGFENKSHRKLLGITYKEIKTNEYIKDVMISLICIYEPIIQSIRRRKLKWYGHKIRHDNLSKTILQGMVEGSRKCDRPKRKWIDDIKEWSKLIQSDLMVKPHDRNEWRRHCITASSLISPTIRESSE